MRVLVELILQRLLPARRVFLQYNDVRLFECNLVEQQLRIGVAITKHVGVHDFERRALDGLVGTEIPRQDKPGVQCRKAETQAHQPGPARDCEDDGQQRCGPQVLQFEM